MNKFQSLYKQFVLNSFFILLFSNLFSNSIDNELWSGIEIQKDCTPKFDIEAGQYIRFKDQFSQFHKTYTDLSLSYKLKPLLEFSGGYRFNVYEDKLISRINFDGKIDLEIKYFNPSLRFRLQREFESKKDPEGWAARNKLTFEIPLTQELTPYTSYERFYVLNDESVSYKKFRFSIGFEFEISKFQSIKLYYIYKGDIDKTGPENTNIWGSKFEYSL